MSNITPQDITSIAEALGSAASLFVPGAAAIVPVATGIIELIDNRLLPIVQSMSGEEASVAEQALVAARTAVEEKRVGAAPAAPSV